jgi:hypothetical protein
VKDAQDKPYIFKEVLQLQNYLNDSMNAGESLDTNAIQAILKYEE